MRVEERHIRVDRWFSLCATTESLLFSAPVFLSTKVMHWFFYFYIAGPGSGNTRIYIHIYLLYRLYKMPPLLRLAFLYDTSSIIRFCSSNIISLEILLLSSLKSSSSIQAPPHVYRGFFFKKIEYYFLVILIVVRCIW